jgi:hypothetical protein
MRILQEHQYNQGIGKYKLLSSTAGVGSIITSKFGTYVLVSDINKWINKHHTYLKDNNLLQESRKNVIKAQMINLMEKRLHEKYIKPILNDKKFEK